MLQMIEADRAGDQLLELLVLDILGAARGLALALHAFEDAILRLGLAVHVRLRARAIQLDRDRLVQIVAAIGARFIEQRVVGRADVEDGGWRSG
ncbi:hypothetical protein [Sphingomonas sp. SRS2]|uniref:hypothetical protein n=1 Tax=Sphingomonas sp. SRS2 TaxID=133190 RepID=UPI0006184377|nr:hypothetical protein [Sphingomonas sp. SRS2]KKC27302.1 hypothetical protein WP12_03915 [Sphingomonas sp. SRS2]